MEKKKKKTDQPTVMNFQNVLGLLPAHKAPHTKKKILKDVSSNAP